MGLECLLTAFFRWIPVDLRGGLRAKNTSRIGTQLHIEMDLIASDQSATECAGIDPGRRSVASRRDQFQGAGCLGAGDFSPLADIC